MNIPQVKKRMDFLDIAKGIGIILVIIGHAFRDEMRIESAFCEFVYQAVYFFHMPLFFAISGVTFGLSYQKYVKTPLLFVKRKVLTQIVPVLAYATAMYVCFLVAFQIPMFQQALSATDYRLYSFWEYLELTAFWNNPYSVHLWYLWVLFIASIMAFLFLRCVAGKPKADLYFAAGALVLYVLHFLFSMPYVLERLFEYTAYFAMGMLLSSRLELLQRKSKVLSGAILICCVFLPVYCALNATGFNWGILNQPHLLACWQLICNAFVIFGILRLSCKLENCKPLLYCGKESYNIYLLHQPFCCGFVGVILYNKLGLSALPVYVICCVLSILVPAAFVAVCRRCKPIGKLAKHLLNIT